MNTRFARVGRITQTLLLVIGVSLTTSCGNGQADPGDAVISFFEAIEAGEISQAADMTILPPDVAAVATYDLLRSFLSDMATELEQKGGLESAEVLDEEIDGKSASVRLSLRTGDGEQEEASFDLLFRDSAWKVLFGSGTTVSVDAQTGKSGENAIEGPDVEVEESQLLQPPRPAPLPVEREVQEGQLPAYDVD